MEFKENFFEGETRNGFYIRPMMKKYWAAGLEVLEEVAKLCKKHDIPWFAEFGTLLGAIREKGFIAWDDDIDISMMRKDYERFRHYAKTELPEGWFCLNERGDVQGALICRVVNSHVICTDKKFLEKFHYCPYINGVDVFVYDNIPAEQPAFEQYVNLVQIAWGLSQNLAEKYEDTDDEVKDMIAQMEEISGVHLDRNKGMKSQLLTLAEHISAMYMDQESEGVAVACKLLEKKKYVFRKEWFEKTVMADFEGMKLPVPADYDKVLRVWYGDNYMTPIRGAAGHNYPVFAKQEELLFEEYAKRGLEVPEIFRE